MDDNNAQLNSQSFNDSELSKGFHLLTESSHTVKVNTRAVPLNMVHLYPRLAGSNWTSYLSQPSVILGRSGTVVTVPNTRQKQYQPSTQPQVDVDFGSSKAISRKHCEVRFSYKRDRWELYVFGRNGIKINHIAKKPRDRPTVLKTGALIEINNTSFVFILPDNYIKPIEGGIRAWEEETNAPNNNDVEDLALDHELEIAMIDILEKRSCLNTKEILEELKKTYPKPVEKENILHLLVLSSRFHLAPNSISMSSKESDSVKWMLIPLPVNLFSNSQLTSASKDNDYSINAEKSTDDMSITTPNTLNTPNLEKGKTPVMSLASTDDMSITSTPALAKKNLPFTKSRDDMSITTPNNLMQVSFMRIDSFHDHEQPHTPNESFSRFFDGGEEGWSVFMPADPPAIDSDREHDDNDKAREAEETNPHKENDNTPNIPIPAPTLFRGMSIESMYSVWSHSTSFVRDPMDDDIDEVRPTKRLRQAESNDNMSIDDGAKSKEASEAAKEIDIFKKLRTQIVYTA